MQKLIIYIYINSTHSGNVVYSCICNRKTLVIYYFHNNISKFASCLIEYFMLNQSDLITHREPFEKLKYSQLQYIRNNKFPKKTDLLCSFEAHAHRYIIHKSSYVFHSFIFIFLKKKFGKNIFHLFTFLEDTSLNAGDSENYKCQLKFVLKLFVLVHI